MDQDTATRLAEALARGYGQGFGDTTRDPIGIDPEGPVRGWLYEQGVYGSNPLQKLNELLITGASQGVDAGLRAVHGGIRGSAAYTGQLAEELTGTDNKRVERTVNAVVDPLLLQLGAAGPTRFGPAVKPRTSTVPAVRAPRVSVDTFRRGLTGMPEELTPTRTVAPMARKVVKRDAQGRPLQRAEHPVSLDQRTDRLATAVTRQAREQLRQRRALEQGYDRDVYHGTERQESSFIDDGDPIFTSKDPYMASSYADDWLARDHINEGPNVLPLKTRGKIATPEEVNDAARAVGYDEQLIGESMQYMLIDPTYGNEAYSLIDELKRRGFSGAEVWDFYKTNNMAEEKSTVMFDPKDLRSQFDNFTPKLSDEAVRDFTALGEAQRGAPEQAMLRVQRTMGGGVLNPVVEHVGDLTHRMSHMAQYDNVGREFVLEKTEKMLRALRHPYGFAREMRENVANNAPHRGVEKQELDAQINRSLQDYADAHRRLPVYNRPQWLAREAAVAVGDRRWATAEKHLEELDVLARDRDLFEVEARKYDPNYQPGPIIKHGETTDGP